MINFLIYGAGALGQALGCMLASAGHPVDLVLRERYHEKIVQQGLNVTGILGDFSAPQQNLTLLTKISQATNKYDYVLLTTKAYDTQTAVNNIATLGKRAATIVSMQNGCGNIELLENRFGREKSLGGRVITGFEIVSPGLINITVSADAIHVGSCRSGTIPHCAKLLAELITNAGHRCLAVEDIHQAPYGKGDRGNL